MRCGRPFTLMLLFAAGLAIFCVYLYNKSILNLSFLASSWNLNITQQYTVSDTAKKRYPGLTFIGEPAVEYKRPDLSHDIAVLHWVWKIQVSCDKALRVGHMQEGGWDICLSEPFNLKDPCLIYSFGISGDTSFDDELSDRYNCTVRSFDPTIGWKSHYRGKKKWFYDYGLDAKDYVTTKNWTMKTLNSLRNLLNDSNTVIDVLKFDIELSEYPAIKQMYASGVLDNVKQLLMEAHMFYSNKESTEMMDVYNTLRLLELAGFRRWFHRKNICPFHLPPGMSSICAEMSYINTKFLV